MEKTGGWDPYNLTEDADLGIRLARFGYRSATLSLPTYEEAPVEPGPWLRQRSRWFQGWMQTWLVHMRRPLRLWRELGTRQFIGFNLMGLGMIISTIAHPAFVAILIVALCDWANFWRGGLVHQTILVVDIFNLVAAYLAMTLLVRKTLAMRGRARQMRFLFLLPLYWFAMTAASFRALWKLAVAPHHWEKTPHRGRAADEPQSPSRTAERTPLPPGARLRRVSG